MSAKRNVDYRAAQVLSDLIADRGWTPKLVADESLHRTGHPMRHVSERTVYRVLKDGHLPTNPLQFEIAAALGLLPSHIWGRRPLPAGYEFNPLAAAA